MGGLLDGGRRGGGDRAAEALPGGVGAQARAALSAPKKSLAGVVKNTRGQSDDPSWEAPWDLGGAIEP
jgi:hypothetical protein